MFSFSWSMRSCGVIGETFHLPLMRMKIRLPSLIDSDTRDLSPIAEVVNEWCGVVAARNMASNTALQPTSPARANPDAAHRAATQANMRLVRGKISRESNIV